MKILFSVSMLLLVSVAFGQAEKTVSPMKAGTKLTDADIGFLSMVSNANLDASRGATTRTATINKVTYSAGQTLTAAQAKSIQAAATTFQKTYRTAAGSRGAGYCYYWYYWCNGYGYCYWYRYWYYC